MAIDPDIEKLESLFEERSQKIRAQQRKAKRIYSIATLIATGLGIAASYIAILKISTRTDPALKAATDAAREFVMEHDRLKKDVARIGGELSAIGNLPPESAVAAAQAKLTARIQEIDKRMTSIESAITDSPEKALAIPLLRRDINDATKRAEEYRLLAKSDLDRVYAQQTWILGGIGTALLAIAGGAVTMLARSMPRGKAEGED
jgi:hypothetical protein